ncbi:calcium/sodium antiporter [Phragmitibacter flavus]|uniref:Calcium/sodium antiporter n=1 Tax=Phragmitibacter flavus TaxID=2576071 RepID=A0A5R8KJ05_9BACT|nr:calcium/sodium antiporter [Phragmitibacter flavus]TLD72240.1 calcium/sodium antiporter [Phragmitibacter flavus]
MLLSVTLIVAGLVALYYGAEWLVRGATSLALKLGMTPLIAGLTVVAFGTSSPELVVSLTATLQGQGDIALGNVVGSNIFNIAVILAITAIIVPLRVEFQLLKFDTPFMIASAGLFLWFFQDRSIDSIEAAILFGLLVVYVAVNVWLAKRQTTAAVNSEYASGMEAVDATATTPGWKIALLLVIGLGVLVAGSKAFVSGAVEIARTFQISEAIIGLTIVAAGTSLPELASSLVAAMRKQADIAIGNVIGSSIFNILCILGISGMAAGPLQGPGISQVDLYVMFGFSLVLMPILWTSSMVRRWEGVVLLAGYGAYLAFIWPK